MMFKFFSVLVFLFISLQMITINAEAKILCPGNQTLANSKCVSACPARCNISFKCLSLICHDQLPCICKSGYILKDKSSNVCIKSSDCPKL